MKRIIAAATLGVLLLTPVSAFAYRGHHRGHHRGDAVAWGILGGIIGGVVLDRVLWPPPVIVRHPVHNPYPYAYYSEPYGGGHYRRGGDYRSAPRPRCHDGWRGGYRY